MEPSAPSAPRSTRAGRRAELAVLWLTSLLASLTLQGRADAAPAGKTEPPGAVAPAAAPPGIEIEGNLVLVDEVYLAAVDVPPGAAATPDVARLVERQILAFLRRAGYALATAHARAEDGRIRVMVDEGRLSKIVVRGRDAFSTLAVRMSIDLPYDVFNRPQLERVLSRFSGRGEVSYRLVPARAVDHVGFQVNPLSLLPGAPPLAAEGVYELHVAFAGPVSGASFNLVAGIDPDSIRAGGSYTVLSGLLDRDRWELQSQVGANYFENLRSQTDELHFSRVFADTRWLAPPFWLGLRPTLRLREDLLRRQRQDFLVESYWWNRAEAAAGLTLEPRSGLSFGLEVGAQQRDLFAVTQLPEADPDALIAPSSSLLPFLGLTAALIFDPDRFRVDRRHRLQLETRHLLGRPGHRFWLVEAEYRRVFEFGWNDLWLHAAAAALTGHYDPPDALPMTGRYLRGVFGHELYLDRAASVGFDYRLSLTRDVFKIGAYHDAAVLRQAVTPSSRPYRVANSLGPSFHTLVLDVLQVDIYYSFGFIQEGSFEHGISMRVEKAF